MDFGGEDPRNYSVGGYNIHHISLLFLTCSAKYTIFILRCLKIFERYHFDLAVKISTFGKYFQLKEWITKGEKGLFGIQNNLSS